MQQPNAKSQRDSSNYNCVGLHRKQHRTTSWFLFSEMHEGMHGLDNGGLGSDGGWDNGLTNSCEGWLNDQ
jgi:hypothetical protein